MQPPLARTWRPRSPAAHVCKAYRVQRMCILRTGHTRVQSLCCACAITSCARLVLHRRGAPRGRSPRAGRRVAWGQPQLLAHGPGHVGKRCRARDLRDCTHSQLAPQRGGTSREGAVVPPQAEPSRDARSGRARQRRVRVVCAGERHFRSHVAALSSRKLFLMAVTQQR